jgi:hypothetical protein
VFASATLTTSRREAFLAFTMDARRARTQVRAAGGGDRGAAAVLVRHLRGLDQAIGGADLEAEDWLGTRDLAEAIRTAFDPGSQAHLAARRAAAAQARARGTAGTAVPPGVSPDLAGPVYAEARPGSYLHDGAVSASYWVHSWPRQAYSTALGPLLGDGSHRRSFGIIFEPLHPRAAEKAVMRERTARHVAVRMRQRTGQIVPEHVRTAMERALQQDAERAAGHGLVRFAGYATVTAQPGSIEDACAPWKPTRPPRGSRCAACGSPRTPGSRSVRCRWAWACRSGGGDRARAGRRGQPRSLGRAPRQPRRPGQSSRTVPWLRTARPAAPQEGAGAPTGWPRLRCRGMRSALSRMGLEGSPCRAEAFAARILRCLSGHVIAGHGRVR